MQAKQYVVVKQPCGQEFMVAKALQGTPALQSSASAPMSFPLGMHCNSTEPHASNEHQAMLACSVLTEAEEGAALQRTVSQLLGAEDAASVEQEGPIQCLEGQTSVQLGRKDCGPADATQLSGLAVSSSEQEVSRHLGEGALLQHSTFPCHRAAGFKATGNSCTGANSNRSRPRWHRL